MWAERNTSKNRKLSLEHGGLVARGKTIGVSLHPIMLSPLTPHTPCSKTTPHAFRPSVHCQFTPPSHPPNRRSVPALHTFHLALLPFHLAHPSPLSALHRSRAPLPSPRSCQGEWRRCPRQVRSVCANMADSLGQLQKSRRVNSPGFRIV